MVRVYTRDKFDLPRKKRRLAWYVEVLCARLFGLEEITEDTIADFWREIRKKQRELSFPWQRKNLTQEAKEQLDKLLSQYYYDAKNRVYKRVEEPSFKPT